MQSSALLQISPLLQTVGNAYKAPLCTHSLRFAKAFPPLCKERGTFLQSGALYRLYETELMRLPPLVQRKCVQIKDLYVRADEAPLCNTSFAKNLSFHLLTKRSFVRKATFVAYKAEVCTLCAFVMRHAKLRFARIALLCIQSGAL